MIGYPLMLLISQVLKLTMRDMCTENRPTEIISQLTNMALIRHSAQSKGDLKVTADHS